MTAPAGEWVEVDAADVKDGDRVRLGGVEGVASTTTIFGALRLYAHTEGVGIGAWVWATRSDGARVEVWRPAEVTLPLPTNISDVPFIWGRAGEGRDLYVGPMLTVSTPGGVKFVTAYGDYIDPSKVTRLPLPDEKRAELQ